MGGRVSELGVHVQTHTHSLTHSQTVTTVETISLDTGEEVNLAKVKSAMVVVMEVMMVVICSW